MELQAFIDRYPKFYEVMKSGCDRPAYIVQLAKGDLINEQTLQADWTANSQESNVDYATTMGDVTIAKAATLTIENTTSNTWEDIMSWSVAPAPYYYMLSSKLFWQSFKQTGGSVQALSTVEIYVRKKVRTGGHNNFTVLFCEIWSADKSTKLTTTLSKSVTNETGEWIVFDFSAQNIQLLNNTQYWIKTYIGSAGATFSVALPNSVEIAYQNTSVYANGQLDRYIASWSYNIGDMKFRMNYIGFEASGYIRTQTMDIGETPIYVGEWVFDDSVPTGCSLTYQAWSSATGAFAGEETDLGAVTDGMAITDLKRYYRVKASFTANAAQSFSPTLRSIKATFIDFIKYSNRHSTGYEPALKGMSSLSTTIDMFDKSTISQITLRFALIRSIAEYLYNDYPKNKIVRIQCGYETDDFTESDYVDYFTGVIDDWNISGNYEISIVVKDFSKEWNQKVPAKWESVADDVAYAAGDVSPHPCDRLLDILQNQIAVRDSKIDIDSFNIVKALTPSFVCRRLITKDSIEAADLIEELRQIMCCFFVPRGDGKITLRRYDPDDNPVASLDHNNSWGHEYQGNAKSLLNIQHIYFEWDGDGDEASDYLSLFIGTDTSSQDNWDEKADRETKVKWGGILVAGTDGKDYFLIKSHTSAADNKPVTGGSYATYWKDSGLTGLGKTWVTDTVYEHWIETMATILNTRFSNPAPIMIVECDRNMIYIDCGDMVLLTSKVAPSTDLGGIIQQKFQVTQRAIDFDKDKIRLQLLRA